MTGTTESLTRALHRHVCGTDWDEWNQPCSWAGEDWDRDKGPATCAYVGEVGVEAAVLAWISTLADDEALVYRVGCGVFEQVHGVPPVPGYLGEVAREHVRINLRALAAALTERGQG